MGFSQHRWKGGPQWYLSCMCSVRVTVVCARYLAFSDEYLRRNNSLQYMRTTSSSSSSSSRHICYFGYLLHNHLDLASFPCVHQK